MANGKGNASGETAPNKVLPMLSADELISIPVEELYLKLETSPQGLSSEEANNRLEVYGPNELAKRKKHSALIQFLMNFKSPLVIILMVAGLHCARRSG
jgi:P-type Mg2+ transporter